MTTLKKLVSLKALGRFKSYSATGNVELGKLNLIYGENGKGKTTVCAMLRSLSTGDPATLLGRKSLGHSVDPDIHILLSTGTVTFKNGVWSQKLENLAIFDQTYVSENVHSGELVGSDQRKNLYRVIVGEQGVQLATLLDKLNEDARKLQSEIRQKRKTLEATLGDIKLDDFLAYSVEADLDLRIIEAQKKLQNAQDAGQLKLAPALAEIAMPTLVTDLDQLLSKSLEGISSDAEKAVKEHLVSHGMKSNDQEWLSKGVTYDSESGCPYCGQSLDGVDLVNAYKKLFSDAYRALKQELISAGQTASQRLSDVAVSQLGDAFERNATQHTFWSTKLSLDPIAPLNIATVKDALVKYREAVLAVLRMKVASPLESVSVPEAVTNAAAEVFKHLEEVASYNKAIAADNVKISLLKAGLAQTDVVRAQKELKQLQTLKTRSDPKLAPICEELIKLEKDKVAIENQKIDVKDKLDAYGARFTKAYQNRINAYLDNFGATFRIAGVDHNYVGGVNAKYSLVINGTTVPLGDEDTPLSEPSFRNTLSAGDKSTLALALFLAQLDEDANPGEKIIVFDDPFSSQDRFRRTQTQLEIVSHAAVAAQTFVFSHDAQFLVDLNEKAVELPVKALRVSPVGDEQSTIAECNLGELCKPTQLAMIESLMRYRQQTSLSGHKPEDIVQKLRPVLEAHCNNTCPTGFGMANNLGGMVSEIRTKGESHTLYEILGDLHEINEFAKRHHHDDKSIQGPIDETELLTYCKRTLRIVGAL